MQKLKQRKKNIKRAKDKHFGRGKKGMRAQVSTHSPPPTTPQTAKGGGEADRVLLLYSVGQGGEDRHRQVCTHGQDRAPNVK